MFNVKIQAINNTWFNADGGEALDAEAADRLIVDLRAQGFTARAVFVEDDINEEDEA